MSASIIAYVRSTLVNSEKYIGYVELELDCFASDHFQCDHLGRHYQYDLDGILISSLDRSRCAAEVCMAKGCAVSALIDIGIGAIGPT